MELEQSGICNVVVGALGVVSRPDPLKSFIYLDFIDKTKRENVMTKLHFEIGMPLCVCGRAYVCVHVCINLSNDQLTPLLGNYVKPRLVSKELCRLVMAIPPLS